ncbi:hypothetical protein WMF31_06375 [Sorangium sp. So ce1036]|uniref:hypothetical protein n=1 Tax=Sorangium sp. So ce1036 TaxID=3133328 RepID=UPI003F02011E
MEKLELALMDNVMSGEKCYRERIREVLELLSSPQLQRAYQARAPAVNVAEELFNQWEDWYHPESVDFVSQFSSGEMRVLEEFSEVVDSIAGETPQVLPPLEEFMNAEACKRLCAEAQKALRALAIHSELD